MSAPSLSRAQFLRGAVGLTSAAVGSGLMAPIVARAEVASAPAAQTASQLQLASFELSLGGAHQGRLADARGGSAYAEPSTKSSGPRTLGPTKYRGLDLSINLALDAGIYDAINAAWAGRGRPLSGSVFRVVQAGRILERRFEGAQIVATSFPAFDTRHTDQTGWVTVRLTPDRVRDQLIKSLPFAPDPTRLRVLRTHDFALDMGALSTKGVVRVESFAIRAGADQDPVGIARVDPRAVGIPMLKVSVYRQYADDWVKWHNAMVVDRGAGDVKDGALRFLSVDGASELARINLINPGICELSEPAADSSETEDVLVASVYCERMELTGVRGLKH